MLLSKKIHYKFNYILYKNIDLLSDLNTVLSFEAFLIRNNQKLTINNSSEILSSYTKYLDEYFIVLLLDLTNELHSLDMVFYRLANKPLFNERMKETMCKYDSYIRTCKEGFISVAVSKIEYFNFLYDGELH